jgi:nucleotide-binding universal stress UspA family protein
MESRRDDQAAEAAIRLGTVLCGVDPSPQSTAALDQGVQLADEGAQIWAVAAWDPRLAMHAGLHAAEVRVGLRREAVSALESAKKENPSVQPMLINGPDVAALLSAVANLRADLISVGSHGGSRAAGIVFGSVATAMVHHAPCCVLVARSVEAGPFPRLILHAGDGSPDSLDAARLAGSIAARRKAGVVTLNVGEGLERGAGVAEEAAAIIEAGGGEPVIELETGSAPRRIVEVAGRIGADLIVVGSRGLTGIKALGSVSERVVHRASCSVLVVRPPTAPTEESI